jgi:hypothetical protein
MKKIIDRASYYKLNWWEKIWLPIADKLNEYNFFYTSKRQAKKFYEEIDRVVEKTNYSENFVDDWQIVFAEAVKEIKRNGWWNISSSFPHEHDKYVQGILDSFPLNGIKSVKLINEGGLELLFVDMEMSAENRKAFQELTAEQKKNSLRNLEWAQSCLVQIEEIEKLFRDK